MNKNVLPLALTGSGLVAVAAAVVIAAGGPAAASGAASATTQVAAADGLPAVQPLSSIVKQSDQTTPHGTNNDSIMVTASKACSAEATKHKLLVAQIQPSSSADQAAADQWADQNLYTPTSVGLPGPLSVFSSQTMQQWSDQYHAPIVPGVWTLELRCTNNLGNVVYDRFQGTVTFTSPTEWKATGATPPPTTSTTKPTTSTSPATTTSTKPGTTTDSSETGEPSSSEPDGSASSDDSGTGGQLADTGASVFLLGTLGLGLVGTGGTMLFVRRRLDVTP
ncbi:hypothetical protein GCM10027053_17030 [Intrasporangium mesophilum]